MMRRQSIDPFLRDPIIARTISRDERDRARYDFPLYEALLNGIAHDADGAESRDQRHAASPELAAILEPDGTVAGAIAPSAFAGQLEELAQWKTSPPATTGMTTPTRPPRLRHSNEHA